MAAISLIQIARLLGSQTALEMVDAVGLTRPPPPVSLRNVVKLAGVPEAPADLKMFWDSNVAGQIIFRPPDAADVPSDRTIQFEWRDPAERSLRKARSFDMHITIATTGTDFENSPFPTPLAGSFALSGFKHDTRYSWHVVPFNEFGVGPSSPVFTFATASLPVPPPPLPSISVVYHPPAASAKFSIKGSGFVRSHVVHIRGVNSDALQNPAFADTTSDSSGAIDLEVSIPCPVGTRLSFSANDERPNPHDVTGTLFSNTVTITTF